MSAFTGLISSAFKQLHTDMILEVVRGCSVTCTVTFGITKYTDCANCWESGTLIKTERGFKPIEDILIGEVVCVGSNQYKKVKDKRTRLYDGEVFEIQTWGSSLPHRVTANHKFPILKNFRQRFKQREWYDPDFVLNVNDKIEEVEAKNISLDDALIIPYNTHQKIDAKYWNGYKITEDLLYLFGWWIAEGCLHIDKYTRSGSFCLCASKEEHVANKLQKILLNIFGISSTLEYRDNADNLLVTWHSSNLAKLLLSFGHRAENKHIPADLWQALSLKQKWLILCAYHSGDGHTCNYFDSVYDLQSITTVSETLALQVYDILINYGYYPSISWKKESIDKNGVHHQRNFSVIWQKNRIQQKSNIRKSNLGLLAKVYQLKKTHENIFVHNLEVEDIHRYVAGNYLTCNCVFDPIGNKSANRYQSGGPMPFTTGTCPMCSGVGKIPDEQTSTISAAPIYDYRSWIPIATNIQSPLGFVQTLSIWDDTYNTIRRAKEIIIDTSLDSQVRQRFQRYGEPHPCGLGDNEVCVAMWKRIENG